MAGFCLTRHPDSSAAPLTQGRWSLESATPGDEIYQASTEEGAVVLDGYAHGLSQHDLARALAACDEQLLAGLDGHFAALVMGEDGTLRGHSDRLGSRTLYWSESADGGLSVASRWDLVPKGDWKWDPEGLSETLRYRLTTGPATLVSGVSQLPRRHRVEFPRSGEPRLTPLAPLIDWHAAPPEVPLRRKIDETRSALTDAIDGAARSFDKAAVLLSGGVDSSLLAALAGRRFRDTLLVTPLFSGRSNPELAAARAFADTLQLEHLLVPIDERTLEPDLRTLVRITGMQINFQMLAMHQLFRAIPDEYRLVILGDAADTLFGTKRYARVERSLRLKERADRLPNGPAKALGRLPLRKARSLARLRRLSAMDLAMEPFAIPYDDASRRIVGEIADADLGATYAHRRMSAYLENRTREGAPGLRQVLADIGFNGRTAQHFAEEVLSASWCGKRYFLPFLSPPVIEAARNLSDAQYFGKQHAKPVLRELACEHYDRRLVYRKKLGFEVPDVAWLEGPLAHLVDAARQERRLFDGRVLADLSLSRHYPLYWSLIGLKVAAEEMRDEHPGAFAAEWPGVSHRQPRGLTQRPD